MSSYIARHWRGELSLPQSYWVNGVLLGMPVNIYFAIAKAAIKESPSASAAVYYLLIPFAVFFFLAVWQGVGIWRSAGRRIAEGRSGWAWIARLVVLGNLAFVAYSLAVGAPMNYAVVRAFLEERAAHFSIQQNGTYVVFHGTITQQAANELAPALQAEKVRRLVINGSNGGFLRPTLQLTHIIETRRLWVTALAECDSACTGLVAAGEPRAISPDTIVGLHRGTIAGVGVAPDWSDIEAIYRRAGMSTALFAKMRAHSGPADIYEPTIRELIEGGFVNAIYVDAAKAYQSAPEWCRANPAQCDRTGRQNAAAAKPIPKPQPVAKHS